MMKLSTMLRVDRQIDDDGRSQLADRILDRWESDRASARFFRSSANFVFRLRRAGAPFYLRFADSRERRRRDVGSEMEIVASLAAAGVVVPAPVPSRAGRSVKTVETDTGTFHAVVLTALEGQVLEIDDLEPRHFRAWGATMARLHSAASSIPANTVAARRSWRDDQAFIGRYIPPDRSAVRRECEDLATVLTALPTDSATYGLIHFDLELDNLVWQGSGIGILDFDDCARYWYAADIALALRDLFEDGFDPEHPSLAEFLRGYESERPIERTLIATLPTFLRLGELLRYARLRRSLDLPSAPGHPAWLAALRDKLDRYVNAYEASLSSNWSSR